MAFAFSLSIAKLRSLVSSPAFGTDLCGGLGIFPIVSVEGVVTGHTRNWDKGAVVFGVDVAMLAEFFVTEDMVGVIVASAAALFLDD